jgi:hypothetical protein
MTPFAPDAGADSMGRMRQGGWMWRVLMTGARHWYAKGPGAEVSRASGPSGSGP